jgi:hypothetical protein
MKSDTLAGLVVALAVALVGGALLAVWLIGAETLRIMGLVLIGGLALAGIVAATALPIRAWRKRDGVPIEKHVFHEGRQVIRERVIDSRPALPVLPGPQQAPFGVFPELLQASYRAGLLAQPGAVVDAEVRALGPADGWNGDIAP